MRVSFQQVTSADTFRRRAQKNEPAPRGPWASSKPALGSGRRSPRVEEVSSAVGETAGCLPPHRPERAGLPHSVPQT